MLFKRTLLQNGNHSLLAEMRRSEIDVALLIADWIYQLGWQNTPTNAKTWRK